MDYGKLAYQITSDLSYRITSLEQKITRQQTRAVKKLSSNNKTEISDGGDYGGISFICSDSTAAVAVARIRINFSVAQSSVKIQFYNSGLLVSDDSAAFGTGGQDYFTILSFPVEKNVLNTINVRLSDFSGYGELEFVELLLIADNIITPSEKYVLAAATGGGYNFAGTVNENKLIYYISDASVSPLSAEPKIIDNVSDFAALYHDGGFLLALTDKDGFLSIQYTSGGVNRYDFCGGVTSPALVPYGGANSFGKVYYIKDGGLYERDIMNTLSLGSENTVDCGISLKSVTAITNADSPQLILSGKNNRLYYLGGIAQQNAQAECLKISLRTYCL